MTISFLLLRLSLAWVFLWAFFDKIFGLGFSTKPAMSWLLGHSPTTGYLKMATTGPLKTVFSSLSGMAWVDWLFMLGILCLGLALLFGVARKLTAYAGTLFLLLMWASAFPPKTNPVIDEHIVYIFILWVLLYAKDQKWTLNNWWTKNISKKLPILE